MPIINLLVLILFILILLVALFSIFQYRKLAIYVKEKYPDDWQQIHKNYWMTGRGGAGEYYRVLDWLKQNKSVKNDDRLIKLIKSVKLSRIAVYSLLAILLLSVLFFLR